MNGKLARFFVSFHVGFVVSEPDCTIAHTAAFWPQQAL